MADLTVAVAQFVAVPRDLERSVQRHLALAALAARQGARIVLFPELSLTGYDRHLTVADALDAAEPRLQPLRALADSHQIVIVVGAPVASAKGLHIAALSFGPGAGTATYLKEFLHEGEESAFIPGSGGDQLPLGGHSVGLAICADITHPDHAARTAGRGATIYAASCFLTEQGYQADTALLRGYARAHRMVVLMANYGAPIDSWCSAGRSAIWSSTGELLACAPPEGEALISAAIGDGSGSSTTRRGR